MNINRIAAPIREPVKRGPLVIPKREMMPTAGPAEYVEPASLRLSREPAEKSEAWRFAPEDTKDWEAFGIGLLLEKFPDLSLDGLASWLGAMTNRNDCLFVRSAKGFALFEVKRSPWFPDGRVEEHWLVAEKQFILESSEVIYREAIKWAASIGCKSVKIFASQAAGPIMERLSLPWRVSRVYEIGTQRE